MKDYSAMSDFEINKAVDDILHPPKPRHIKAYNSNYCNNPADAWPIIVANSIDIIQDNGLGCAIATSSAVQMFQREDVHIEQDENGLRAAMIVYLQMMEQK